MRLLRNSDASGALLDLARLVEFGRARREAGPGRAAAKASTVELDAATTQEELQFVSFLCAGSEYAMPIHEVREIVQLPPDVVRVGGRVTFANGVVMRLFTSAGASLLSDGRWKQESRLASSPSGERFETAVRNDRVVGRLAVGAQVFATDRLELRLQYEGEYSQNLTGHGGSLSLAMRF